MVVVGEVETTGINPKDSSIIEVALAALREYYGSNFEVAAVLYLKCLPRRGAKIYKGACKVNGYNHREALKDAYRMPYDGLIGKTYEFLQMLPKLGVDDLTLVGQNPNFDAGHLNYGFSKRGIKFRFGHRADDLHSMARDHFSREGIEPPLKDNRTDLNGDKIAGHAGIPPEPMPHTALNGVMWEAEILSRYRYGKVLFPMFAGYKIPRCMGRH